MQIPPLSPLTNVLKVITKCVCAGNTGGALLDKTHRRFVFNMRGRYYTERRTLEMQIAHGVKGVLVN